MGGNVCRHIVSVQTMERYLGSKHRFRLLMSGISATASVRRRFARKTDYVIIYGSVSLAQVRQPSKTSLTVAVDG